jgi:hypothetical protein
MDREGSTNVFDRISDGMRFAAHHGERRAHVWEQYPSSPVGLPTILRLVHNPEVRN